MNRFVIPPALSQYFRETKGIPSTSFKQVRFKVPGGNLKSLMDLALPTFGAEFPEWRNLPFELFLLLISSDGIPHSMGLKCYFSANTGRNCPKGIKHGCVRIRRRCRVSKNSPTSVFLLQQVRLIYQICEF